MMPAYWLAAVTASLIIVGGIDWPAGASTFGIGSVVLTLGILVVPVLFLTRQFRLSFVDLLFLSAAARPDEQLPLET